VVELDCHIHLVSENPGEIISNATLNSSQKCIHNFQIIRTIALLAQPARRPNEVENQKWTNKYICMEILPQSQHRLHLDQCNVLGNLLQKCAKTIRIDTFHSLGTTIKSNIYVTNFFNFFLLYESLNERSPLETLHK